MFIYIFLYLKVLKNLYIDYDNFLYDNFLKNLNILILKLTIIYIYNLGRNIKNKLKLKVLGRFNNKIKWRKLIS